MGQGSPLSGSLSKVKRGQGGLGLPLPSLRSCLPHNVLGIPWVPCLCVPGLCPSPGDLHPVLSLMP